MSADNVYSYRRKSISGSELIVILNFSPVKREGHRLRVPSSGRYKEIFNSDEEEYGGSGIQNDTVLKSQEGEEVYLTIPPLSGIIIKKLPGNTGKEITAKGRNKNER